MRKYIFLIFILTIPISMLGQIYSRSDTLFIGQMPGIPDFNGGENIDVWNELSWNNINQIWMPYDNKAGTLSQEGGLQLWEGEQDFNGRFKIGWSSQTNLIYFLVEITDDVFVGGYNYNENPSTGGGYPNYDILEIFIDENRSGGLHVFDGTGSFANEWGSNAENAFSYHLAVDAPEDGIIQENFHALDISGSAWGFPNQKIADYSGHFPQFSMKRDGNTYTWQFSLQVHNHNFDNSNPEASEVTLSPDKILGLSVAYCDNDNADENPLSRDHFIGSVEVPLSAYNDHWKNADWFGVAKLIEENPTFSSYGKIKDAIEINNFISNQTLNVTVDSPDRGNVNVRILNILGIEMLRDVNQKLTQTLDCSFNLMGWSSGVYILEVIHQDKRVVSKFIIR